MPRKEKASKASGVGISDVYVSSWRFINDLDVLNASWIPRKRYSNIDLETEEVFLSNLKTKLKPLKLENHIPSFTKALTGWEKRQCNGS